MLDLRTRTLAILTRPGGGRIGMTELKKALGRPRSDRVVPRIVGELVLAGRVRRVEQPVSKESPGRRFEYARPAGTARRLGASGVNLPALVEGAKPRPKRKRFWAWMFERAAINKAQREQQEAHAQRGAP